jgi:DNA-binding MarR family transcriptional regulator
MSSFVYLDSPLHLFRRVSIALKRAYHEALQSLGVSDAQAEVLTRLWLCATDTGIEQRALQEAMNVSSATCTTVVDSLVIHGLVQRDVSAHDARVKQLTLTSKGRALESQLGASMALVQDRLLSGFSAADRTLLTRLLERAAGNLNT